MSSSLTGERQPTSDRVIDFGGRQRQRVQQGGPWRLGFQPAGSAGVLPGGAQADSKMADSLRSVGWDRDAQR